MINNQMKLKLNSSTKVLHDHCSIFGFETHFNKMVLRLTPRAHLITLGLDLRLGHLKLLELLELIQFLQMPQRLR